MTNANIDECFVHLRAHTDYSIVDGLLRIKPLIQRAAECKMPAVAMTDYVNLFGLVKFYREAISHKIKPIIGSDLIICDNDDQFVLTVLCQNKIGYHHLTKLISEAYLKGQGLHGPMISPDLLMQYHEGLIVLSGGKQGDVGRALLNGQMKLAKTRLQKWMEVFKDRYYLELQRTGREQDEPYLHSAIALASEFDAPVVATNDVRFLDRGDFEAHEARVCIHSGYVLDDPKRPKLYSEQQYFRSAKEMITLFSDVPEAIQNTVEIAKRCNLQLNLGTPSLPEFPIPDDLTPEDYLKKQAQQGLKKRLLEHNIEDPSVIKKYQSRLRTEIKVIVSMGFAGYFLIVADFINWAKNKNIPVGPGRGSGAGSLVAYVLGITSLDPLEHDLLFERFLNPERISMPDFDIDFCMERRDEVIDYVSERYGREAVSQIITFGTMAAKAVVRDVGRVLGFPYGFVDKVAKLIPFELGMTLDKALEQEKELRTRCKNEPEVKNLIDLARKLEGTIRNAGKHAGGVVIAPTQLTDFAPLYCEPDGQHPVTQFDKDDVEAVGLVKFDFLGLRTLTIIDWALQAINKKRMNLHEAPIDIDKIPLNDESTFKLLQTTSTTAVFQLESRGMKDLVRRLRPDNFEDITALVALYRPGPLQSGMVDDFIDRKHGRSSVNYLHPELEPILRSTYGVILYQEQVMQIAQVLAGYSLGGADILRRAMGKKKPEEMAKQRKVFLRGAGKRKIDRQKAEHIFDLMEKFAGYGFNKSHSAAYALLAYQTAWLKAHYPAQFMAAVLSSDMDNTDKVVGFINECKTMQIKVLPPNINTGHYAFTVNDNNDIIYGLGAIKGVGQSAVQHMVEERHNHGKFNDLFDFCARLDAHKISRRVIEPLIKSGAMSDFNKERAVLFASVDKAIKYAEQKTRNLSVGQHDLFGEMSVESSRETSVVDYENVPEWPTKTILNGEKETLGFYLSGHPLEASETALKQLINTSIDQLSSLRNKTGIIGGMLINKRILHTKNGRRMAVLSFEDQTGRVDITLFNQLFEKIQDILHLEHIYIIKGKIEDDQFTGGVRLVAESIESLDAMLSRLAKRVVLTVSDQQQVNNILSKLPHQIKPFCQGKTPITIAYQHTDADVELLLGESWKVNVCNELLEMLHNLCGKSAVAVEY